MRSVYSIRVETVCTALCVGETPNSTQDRRPVQQLFSLEIRNTKCESRTVQSASTVHNQSVKETVKKPIQAAQGESQSRPRTFAAQEGEQRRRLLTIACVVIG